VDNSFIGLQSSGFGGRKGQFQTSNDLLGYLVLNREKFVALEIERSLPEKVLRLDIDQLTRNSKIVAFAQESSFLPHLRYWIF
jgi:hypothetical protein